MSDVQGRTNFSFATSLPMNEVLNITNETLSNFAACIPELTHAKAVAVGPRRFRIDLELRTDDLERVDEAIDFLAENVGEALAAAFHSAVKRGSSQLVSA